jgi:pilus assembly protein CpaB
LRLKKLTLPLGLLCGIAAAVLAFAYLQDQERRIAGPPPPKVSVLIAKSDVPSGARLVPDMVAVTQVLAETKHPQALDSIADVDGKLTLVPLVKGEQILAPRLGDKPKAMTLAGVVPAGRRAVSVAASDLAGVAGLIEPGDWVDVLAFFEDRDGNKAGGMAVIPLENIQVLAVGKEVHGLEAPKDATSQVAGDAKKANISTSPTTPYFSVTLAVTPEEAQRLMIADRSGNLRLALRARGDVDKAALVETDLRTMVKAR